MGSEMCIRDRSTTKVVSLCLKIYVKCTANCANLVSYNVRFGGVTMNQYNDMVSMQPNIDGFLKFRSEWNERLMILQSVKIFY